MAWSRYRGIAWDIYRCRCLNNFSAINSDWSIFSGIIRGSNITNFRDWSFGTLLVRVNKHLATWWRDLLEDRLEAPAPVWNEVPESRVWGGLPLRSGVLELWVCKGWPVGSGVLTSRSCEDLEGRSWDCAVVRLRSSLPSCSLFRFLFCFSRCLFLKDQPKSCRILRFECLQSSHDVGEKVLSRLSTIVFLWLSQDCEFSSQGSLAVYIYLDESGSTSAIRVGKTKAMVSDWGGLFPV